MREVDQLLSNADQAMYAAKNAGRNRLCYFTRALQDSAQQRLKLINDLRSAVAGAQLELHFQPIIDLRQRPRDQGRGAAALAPSAARA